MRSFLITLAVFVFTLGVAIAAVVAQTQTYSPLTGATRVIVSDTKGNFFWVRDPLEIRKFIAVADNTRFGWRALLEEEQVTTFGLAFYNERGALQTIKISEGLVYRAAAPHFYDTMKTREAPNIAHQFLDLIRQAAPYDPHFRCLDRNQRCS